MQHSFQAEGFGVRIRPVQLEDAAFIVWLRNLDHVRGRVGDSATDVAGQRAWLRKYFEREGDYYFLVETPNGIPLGTHGIYDVQGASAEKGRHIIRPDVMAGVAAGTLATELAFDRLGLKELRSTCVSTNLAVRSLHRRSGFKEVGILRAAQVIDGQTVDLFQFLLTAEDWLKVRDRMLPLAELAGAQVREWGETQQGKSQPWEEGKIR